MQTQSVQSVTEQKEIMGLVGGVHLRATFHPVDEQMAKNILIALHQCDRHRSWDVNIQSGGVQFWCDLSASYGYQMDQNELSKGYANIKRRGQELVARLKAGCHVRP